MRRLAFLVLLALEFAVCGCANNTPSTVTNTATSGNWEAQLINPSGGQASLLNFVVSFDVTNSGPLKITGFGFFNDNTCFAKDFKSQTETGNASFTTDSTGHVTGVPKFPLRQLVRFDARPTAPARSSHPCESAPPRRSDRRRFCRRRLHPCGRLPRFR